MAASVDYNRDRLDTTETNNKRMNDDLNYPNQRNLDRTSS